MIKHSPIIDGVLPVYGVPESELSDDLRPEGLFLFIQEQCSVYSSNMKAVFHSGTL